ncbi:hypothetical protein [cf. Phormidesmis sp. LEGE 11477]|uniref:hypothetical protein n=1 Tax=cf. Phormidesmis sp. LEGE 11477 TaxID=1828680 RepID=UPI00187E52A4|nr:hypothetical protein [cf. Phormidesmis sp. LEGE 11477]MBE9063112.1 hypothetical protein [cf. Phormidesmis sp. LEGE 11477]
MLVTDTTLTKNQWDTVDAIARQLVLDETDVSELQKAIAYLRSIASGENAGKRFFDYLKTLVRHGRTIGHSKRTEGYYRSLDEVCSQYLADYQDDADRMLYLLGWAARLVKYYKDGSPVGELKVPEIKSEREAELQAFTEANTFEVGQLLEACITDIKNGKVTYDIQGKIKQSPKEPKLLKKCNITVGQKIVVEIVGLREDGSIRKVKGRCPKGSEK